MSLFFDSKLCTMKIIFLLELWGLSGQKSTWLTVNFQYILSLIIDFFLCRYEWVCHLKFSSYFFLLTKTGFFSWIILACFPHQNMYFINHNNEYNIYPEKLICLDFLCSQNNSFSDKSDFLMLTCKWIHRHLKLTKKQLYNFSHLLNVFFLYLYEIMEREYVHWSTFSQII